MPEQAGKDREPKMAFVDFSLCVFVRLREYLQMAVCREPAVVQLPGYCNSVLVSDQMKNGARRSSAFANCFPSLEQKIAFQPLAFVGG